MQVSTFTGSYTGEEEETLNKACKECIIYGCEDCDLKYPCEQCIRRGCEIVLWCILRDCEIFRRRCSIRDKCGAVLWCDPNEWKKLTGRCEDVIQKRKSV